MNAIVRRTRTPLLWDRISDFDNVVDNLMRQGHNATSDVTLRPAVDVTETAEDWRVVVNLPGIPREGVDVSIDEGVLTISAENPVAKDSENTDNETTVTASRHVLRERSTGKYLRTLKLAEDVVEDAVKAELVNGVLTLTLPKQPKVEPRKISVDVA